MKEPVAPARRRDEQRAAGAIREGGPQRGDPRLFGDKRRLVDDQQVEADTAQPVGVIGGLDGDGATAGKLDVPVIFTF